MQRPGAALGGVGRNRVGVRCKRDRPSGRADLAGPLGTAKSDLFEVRRNRHGEDWGLPKMCQIGQMGVCVSGRVSVGVTLGATFCESPRSIHEGLRSSGLTSFWISTSFVRMMVEFQQKVVLRC